MTVKGMTCFFGSPYVKSRLVYGVIQVFAGIRANHVPIETMTLQRIIHWPWMIMTSRTWSKWYTKHIINFFNKKRIKLILAIQIMLMTFGSHFRPLTHCSNYPPNGSRSKKSRQQKQKIWVGVSPGACDSLESVNGTKLVINVHTPIVKSPLSHLAQVIISLWSHKGEEKLYFATLTKRAMLLWIIRMREKFKKSGIFPV